MRHLFELEVKALRAPQGSGNSPEDRTAVPIDPLLTAEHQLKSPSTEPETSVYSARPLHPRASAGQVRRQK